MARVTEREVKEIIDVDEDIKDLTPFITVANLTVTDVFSGNTQLSDNQLKEIERWLAAHFITAMDPRAVVEENEELRVEYENAGFGEGLKSTRYGRMVLLIDSTGLMGKLGRKQASIAMVDYSIEE